MVLSGSSLLQFPSYWNHKIYCDLHGLDYAFNLSPERIDQSLFLHKIRTIERHLHLADWLFWLDDDAFFMQTAADLRDKLNPHIKSDVFLVICRSPVNEGRWTSISSGQFFIRNSNISRRFIEAVQNTRLDEVERWWDEAKYGLFTRGDQDLMWYNIVTNPLFKRGTVIVDYPEFNARPFHIENSPDEFFLVHFTHRSDMTKREQIAQFATRFDLASCLVDKSLVAPYSLYETHLIQMVG